MPARPRPLDVLFEDERFLAVLKPAGIPVHGGAKTKVKTILERLPRGLRPVHRLDAPTSGVLLLAKTPEAAAWASERWSTAVKTYHALVVGRWDGPEVIDAPLEDPDGRARAAKTRVRAVRLGDRASDLELTIETGRTHQIRRHLSGSGHPVLMDDRYGDRAANRALVEAARAADAPRPKYALLHARGLALESLDLSAPRPARWAAWELCLHLS